MGRRFAVSSFTCKQSINHSSAFILHNTKNEHSVIVNNISVTAERLLTKEGKAPEKKLCANILDVYQRK